MITDNGTCSVNGERVTTCDNLDIYSLSDCEVACTAHKPCVGYFYFKGPGVCNLIPSNIAVNSNNMHLHVMLLNEFQVAVLAAEGPWSVVYSRMQVFLVSPFGKVGSKSFATYITPK